MNNGQVANETYSLTHDSPTDMQDAQRRFFYSLDKSRIESVMCSDSICPNTKKNGRHKKHQRQRPKELSKRKTEKKEIEKEREHFRSINFIAFLLAQQTVAIARTHTQTHMWKKNDAIA